MGPPAEMAAAGFGRAARVSMVAITGLTPDAEAPRFTLDASDDSMAIIRELDEADYDLYEIVEPAALPH